MSQRPRIPVRQGHNAWRLLRTDRDGASLDELHQMTGAVMRHWLVTGADRAAVAELYPTAKPASGEWEWRYGHVRPMRLSDISRRRPPSLPPGKLVADRNSVPGVIPTVAGQRPWQIRVDFWWRAPDTEIDYPALRETIFGRTYTLTDADWILDAAVIPAADAEAAEPTDATWGDAMGDRASEAARAAASSGLDALVLGSGGLALIALAYLLSRK